MARPIRSILFVPGDSEKKLGKSLASAADALVIDLEDSVAASRKSLARDMVAQLLGERRGQPGPALWVRVNPLAGPDCLADLAAIMRGSPVGLLLPKADGPHEVATLGHYLDALEAREGLAAGSTRIIPVATETARASLALPAYRDHVLPRIYGLTWGAEDLSADIGAASNSDEDGRLSLTYRMVRSLVLLAAKASGVEAIDTVYPDFRDLEGFRASCIASRREGFSGRFAVHPDQIEVINEAFSPGEAEIAHAEQVIAAFAEADTGVVAVDGKMLDRPHLVQAQKIIALRDAHSAA